MQDKNFLTTNFQVTASNLLDNERKIGDLKSIESHKSKTVFVRMQSKELEGLEMSIIEPDFGSPKPIINSSDDHNQDDECVNGTLHQRALHFQKSFIIRIQKMKADLLSQPAVLKTWTQTESLFAWLIKHDKTPEEPPLQDQDEAWRKHSFSKLANVSVSQHKGKKAKFAQIWSAIIFIVHTYIFFTCCFFLGIQGFPQGAWLVIEVVFELIIVADTIIRLVVRLMCPTIWRNMALLHETTSAWHMVKVCVATVPQSLILMHVMEYSDLSNLYVAFARCVKLVHIQQLNSYFQVLDLTFRRAAKKSNYMKSAQIVYFTCLFVHLVTCAWCFTARIDPQRDSAGWLRMDGIMEADGTIIKNSQWVMYLDSFFFCHAQMGGIGFGNVVPSTNLEWIVVSVIEVFGASIYFGLYSDIAVEVYRSNQSAIENKKKAEDAKQFAVIHNLPEEVTDKIVSYYQNLRLKFVDFRKKHGLLHEFCTQLQDELVLAFNSELIQDVKFFQMADPAFIVKMALFLSPQICNAGTFVFLMDETADKMYFIHKGKVQILASDNRTAIAHQQQGQYFGEIGCLLTNKRSLSVKSKSTTILFSIDKQSLLDILQEFPKQGRFLRAVGRQRLRSTKTEVVSEKDEDSLNDANLFGKKTKRKNSIQNEIEEDEVDEFAIKIENFQPNAQVKAKCAKPWLTSKFDGVDYFIIIPFSATFYLWNIVLSAAMTYYIFFIPYNIGTHQDMNLVCNIIGICVLILDMPMRAHTAVTDHKTLCLDQTEVLKYYLDNWLTLDLIATIPFELVLMTVVDKESIRWIMLLRLLKMSRLQELSQIIKNQSHMNGSLGTLVQLGFYFFISSHFISCALCLIGAAEYANKTRFNKMTLFGNFSGFKDYIQSPIEELTPFALYGQMWYFAGDIVANVSYGDSVPFADGETSFSILAIFLGRIFIAFIAAESASYLAGTCAQVQTQSIKISVTADWTKRSEFHPSLVSRLKNFHKLVWDDSQGTNINDILDDMPETLRVEIRTEMLQSLIGKWEVLKDDQLGARTAIIKKSQIALYPPNEYIYRASETAEEIFFIIWGKCEVHTSNGDLLYSLGQGQHFGDDFEGGKVGLRSTSVKACVKVSLAVIKLEDFLEICRFYPQIQEGMTKIQETRKLKMLSRSAIVIGTLEKIKTESVAGVNQIQDAEPETNYQSQIGNTIFPSPLKHQKTERVKFKADVREKKIGSSIVTQTPSKSIVELMPEFQSQQDDADSGKIRTLKGYFDVKTSKTQRCAATRTFFTFKMFMSFLNYIVSLYNIVFVPLEFAFRIELTGGLMALNIFTKVFYLTDIIIRGLMIRKAKRINETKVQDIQSKEAVTIEEQQFQTPAKLQSYIKNQIYEIVTSFLAFLPFTLVTNNLNITEPWYVLIALKSVQLCKFRVIMKAFTQLRMINTTIFRIIEVMFYYYIITHYWACVMIASAAYVPDCNLTWLRKVPYPQNGPREPDFFKDTSAWTAYVNGVYFLVSSYSHVNIGDITAISFMEKCATPFINIGGLFMYYLLFSNITLITANFDFASAQRMQTEQKFNQIKNKLKSSGKTPDQVMKNVSDYIEFNISLYDGWEAKDFMSGIPNSIKQDLMFSRFQEAIEESMLFRRQDFSLDIPVAASVFKAMTQQIYLKNEYILKLGNQTKDFIFVLEGEVNVYGMFENKWLGFLASGAHYWNELRPLQRGDLTKSDEQPLQLDDTDNLDGHSLLQLTANTVVVVGILKQEQMATLCEMYPAWKEKLQDLNRYLFELGKKSVLEEASALGKALEREVIIELLQNAYTYSTTAQYNTIVESEQEGQLEHSQTYDLLQSINTPYLQLSVNQDLFASMNLSRQKLRAERNKVFLNVVGHPKALWHYKRFYILRNSAWYRAFEYLQFLNLLYIAVMLPLRIGFQFSMNTAFISIESVSLLFSFFSFLVQLRVPVVGTKKQKTLKLKKVAKYYWEHGFMVDFFGFSPLNLILDIYLLTKDLETQNETMVVVAMFLRLLRVISAWKMVEIQDKFFNHFKIPEFSRNLMKTTLLFSILSHFTVCAWGFLLFVVEKDEPKNWLVVMNLKDAPLPELYLRCFYAVMNIVTTTGSGDVYACTDLERIFFFCMITFGDVLFSLAFGFIASITMLQTVQNDSNTFIEKVIQTEKYMDEHRMTPKQKKQVAEFYAYVFVQKTMLTTLDKDLLYERMPSNLVGEILYYSFKSQLETVFGQFGSENFIKELICRLKGKIFLPDDLVLEAGKFGKEMFFVCDGVLVQLDGLTTYKITKQYGPGDFFGENGILLEQKRSHTVQAQTFCLVNELTKSDFDDVIKSFPLVGCFIKKISEESRQVMMLQTNKKKQYGQIHESEESNEDLLQNSLFSDDPQDDTVMPHVQQRVRQRKSLAQSQLFTTKRPRENSQYDEQQVLNLLEISSDQLIQQKEDEEEDLSPMVGGNKKTERRLSEIDLSKVLKLTQKRGLKLVWSVEK